MVACPAGQDPGAPALRIEGNPRDMDLRRVVASPHPHGSPRLVEIEGAGVFLERLLELAPALMQAPQADVRVRRLLVPERALEVDPRAVHRPRLRLGDSPQVQGGGDRALHVAVVRILLREVHEPRQRLLVATLGEVSLRFLQPLGQLLHCTPLMGRARPPLDQSGN